MNGFILQARLQTELLQASKTMRQILDIAKMVMLILLFCAIGINAQNIGPMPPNPKGCQLTLNTGWNDMEPLGHPLLIDVRIRLFHLREVPDSGGSFAVNTK